MLSLVNTVIHVQNVFLNNQTNQENRKGVKIMPLFKGKDLKEERSNACGCMIKHFPIGESNDLVDWMIVRRGMDMEEKWSMQEHRHADFEEYWFVIEGAGKFYVGDEVYDVEPGDLCITPRGVPHKAIGNMKFVCVTALHNVFGQTVGYKEQFEATDEPYRENPETERSKVGVYYEMDIRSKYDAV